MRRRIARASCATYCWEGIALAKGIGETVMGRLPIRLGLVFFLAGIVGAGIFSWRAATLPALTNDYFSQCRPDEIGAVAQTRGAPSRAGPAAEVAVVFLDRQGNRRVVAGEAPPSRV